MTSKRLVVSKCLFNYQRTVHHYLFILQRQEVQVLTALCCCSYMGTYYTGELQDPSR